MYKYWSVSDRVSVLQISLSSKGNQEIFNIKETIQKFPNSINLKVVRKDNTNFKCLPIPNSINLKIMRTEEKSYKCLTIPKVTIEHQTIPNPKSLISIIDVYAPTSELVDQNFTVLENMYNDINNTIDDLENKSMIFLTGDWNSKVGKKTRKDINDSCLGQFSRGIRNNNGQQLIDFCNMNNLFITNSAFQHKEAHITTWESKHVDPKNPSKTTTIYNQIDYILCSAKIKQSLINSRSFKGTETTSDHRIVICKLSTKKYDIYKNNKNEHTKQFNIQELTKSQEMQIAYQQNLETKLKKDDTSVWKNIEESITNAATEAVGFTKKIRNNRAYNPQVEQLSIRQKQLRLQISNTNDVVKAKELKQERNNILHNIANILNEEKNRELDQMATNIDANYHNNTKMYQAVKLLKRKPIQNPFIHDKNGRNVTKPNEIHDIIREHFQSHFNDPKEPTLQPFTGEPRSLNTQITVEEVSRSVKKLHNNRAAGYDKISPELFKYAPPILNEKITQIFNNIFNYHENVNVSHGILAVLQKPGKPKGPTKNLRPVILLIMLRKVLSSIVLFRIQPKVDAFLSQSQSAYRPGRSTSDIVWSHRFLAARIQKYQEEIFITGIDMTSAFDTIRRTTLIEILQSFLDEDEVRMIRILLSNTVLEIKTKGAPSSPFTTNIGSPQGDGLSGCLFTIYLEKALRTLRNKLNNTQVSQEHCYATKIKKIIPDESVYADDADFINVSPTQNDNLMSAVTDIFPEYNLIINDTKTEQTVLKRGNRNDETWRSTKKLGSLLGDHEDILQRKQLAITSLRNLNEIWIRKNRIRPEIRVKLYKTIVKPVLLYNSQTWGLTKSDENNLDSFHRKQLRIVLHIKYPNIVSNKNIYEITDEIPLSLTISKSRWMFLGHVLRLHEDTPARKSMKYYFTTSYSKGFRGTQRITLPITIDRDLKRANQFRPIHTKYLVKSFNNTSDLNRLTEISSDRILWKELCKEVYEAAQAERLQNLEAEVL